MDTRERILSEAFLLFLDKEMKEVTITDIAKKSEIKNTAVYYYFKDKDEIVYAVMTEFFFSNMNKNTFEKVKFFKGSAKEKITNLYYLILNQKPASRLDSKILNEKVLKRFDRRDLTFFVVESMKYYDCVLNENKGYSNEFKKLMTDIVNEGKQNNEIKKDIETEYMVNIMYHQLLGSIFSLLLNPKINVDKEVEVGLNIFWLLIKN